MTGAEFDKELNKIDFKTGVNTESLEKFLLACLTQLNIYKNHVPNYDLLLVMFSDARNCVCVEFDNSWKSLKNINKKYSTDGSDSFEWEETKDEFCVLIADLVNTREIRSQQDYETNDYQDWRTEGGLTFFNGTTPEQILKYTATRFIGEYTPYAFQERQITWKEFWEDIFIGIIYE